MLSKIPLCLLVYLFLQKASFAKAECRALCCHLESVSRKRPIKYAEARVSGGSAQKPMILPQSAPPSWCASLGHSVGVGCGNSEACPVSPDGMNAFGLSPSTADPTTPIPFCCPAPLPSLSASMQVEQGPGVPLSAQEEVKGPLAKTSSRKPCGDRLKAPCCSPRAHALAQNVLCTERLSSGEVQADSFSTHSRYSTTLPGDTLHTNTLECFNV